MKFVCMAHGLHFKLINSESTKRKEGTVSMMLQLFLLKLCINESSIHDKKGE